MDDGFVSTPLRLCARRAGWLLALLSCAYLAWLTWKSLTTQGAAAFQWPSLVPVLVALTASVLAMMAVAVGWYVLLRGLTGRIPFWRTLGAFALSQPAKYVPGNVLHFASRHALSRGDGMGHGDLIAATVLESASLVTIGLLFGAQSIRTWLADEGWASSARLMALAAVLLWTAALAWVLLRHRARWRSVLWATVVHLMCAAGYFVCSALALGILGGEELQLLSATEVVAAIALSWVAGYLAIGAPGGIGIREALLLAFLGASATNSALLGAILTQRACMIGADLLLFASAALSNRNSRMSGNPQ